MTIVEVVILVVLAIGVLVAWYFAIIVIEAHPEEDKSDFPIDEWEEITAHDLGLIESSIKGLVRVIVAAHRVEEPTNSLRNAVKKNLRDNVEYQFLVSKSRAESEIDGWIHMFLSIARVVLADADSELKPRDLIKISNLSYDWRDTPYVFYQSDVGDGRLSTIAFRGNQTDEGIAERYVRLPGWLAYSMALATLSDAPSPMQIVEQPFRVLPEVQAETHKEDGDHGPQHDS